MSRNLDSEYLLLCKIAETKDIAQALDRGVDEKFFFSKANKRVFSRMRELSQSGDLTVTALKHDFPELTLVEAGQSWDWIIESVQSKYERFMIDDALNQCVDLMSELRPEHRKVTTIFQDLLTSLARDIPRSLDTDFAKTGESRLARYKEWEENHGQLRGIPMGFDFIDHATQGWQPGQLVTFVGTAKSGKTATVLLAALAAFRAGYKPLLISFEMSNEELERRLDSFAAMINVSDLTRGNLSKDDWRSLRQSVHEIENAEIPFIISNDTNSVLTITGVTAKVDEYKPDLLIVDGVYMMADEHDNPPNSPQALTNITRGYKRLAQNKNIPVIITSQALDWKVGKGGLQASSIGYSSSFAQDSSVIIGTERTDDKNINNLKILLGRDVPMGIERRCEWNWETGTFKELPPEDDTDVDDGDSDY